MSTLYVIFAGITVSKFEAFVKTVLSQLYAETIIFGNFTKEVGNKVGAPLL